MAFDKTLPDGDASIGIGDNVIRDNNEALDAGLNLEHYFTTGGNQEMRHRFARDTLVARDAPAVAWQDGSIFFRTDLRTGRLVIQVYDVGAWENVDIEPMDSATSLIPTLPRLDSKSDFIACQYATWLSVPPTVGGPGDQIAMDFATSPLKYSTLDDDTEVVNPTNEESGKGTTVILALLQDGTGGRTVTWQSEYRTAGGETPVVDESPNANTLCYITSLQFDNQYLVTTVPNISIIT